MSSITTRPASEGFGVTVDGVNIASASPDEVANCRNLLFEHGLLLFEDQELDPQEQQAFAEEFGEIVVNRFFTPVPGFPKIAQVLTEADQDWIIGENWHTDHSYDQVPALGSMLYAEEVPPTGGDTCFAGMQCAYDALSEGMKARLEGLTARHDSAHVFAPSEDIRLGEADERDDEAYAERAATYPSAVHPVVLAHPETGRKGLYVNPEFTTEIIGMEKPESDALLKGLFDHILQPQFTFRRKWQPGSIAIWDNRSTWHKAQNDYHGHRRLMRRITLEGTALTQ
ncbi:MAG: TauD/TfdA family dioxygenase [Marinomonas sp.]